MSDVTKKNIIGVIKSTEEMKLIHYTDVSPESIERIAEAVAKRLAKPERPTAHWLGNYCPYTCSNQKCGKTSDSKTPFCRYCGARMVD